MAQRNQMIDITKGFGIICVVLGHNWTLVQGRGELFHIIFSFHMPLFFFLSGVFLRDTDCLKQIIISRFHSLLKPYLVVLVFLSAHFFSELLMEWKIPLGMFSHFYGVIYGTGHTIAWPPMWFLPHLFLANILVSRIIKVLEKEIWQLLYACLSLSVGVCCLGHFWEGPFLFGLLHSQNHADLFWSADLLPITTAFILLGHVFRDAITSLRFHKGWFVLAIAVFGFFHFFFNETIDLNRREYGQFWISTGQALLGIYLCLSLACLCERLFFPRILFLYLGKRALFILMFHYILQRKVLEATNGLTGYHQAYGIFALVLGIGVPCLLWDVAKLNETLASILLPKKHVYSNIQDTSEELATMYTPHTQRTSDENLFLAP